MSDQDQPATYWFHILGGSIPFSVKLSPSEFISAVKHLLVTGHHARALQDHNSDDLVLYMPSNLSQDPLDDLDGRAQQAKDACTEAKVNKTLSQLYPEGPPPGHVHFLIRISEADPGGGGDETVAIHERNALLEKLKIGATKLKRMDASDTRPNNIHFVYLSGSDEAIPSSIPCPTARSLLEQLNRKIEVPKVKVSKAAQTDHPSLGLLRTLKQTLGTKFLEHFQEQNDLKNTDEALLAALIRVGTAHVDKEVGFADNFTALANEACFTALIADPALVVKYQNGYLRDNEACRMIVDLKGQLVQWTPRNDFQIGFGQYGARYGLLHGETKSQGEEEPNAASKMAVMALHSYNVIQHLSRLERPILNVYVSERKCTMYIFYRVPETTPALSAEDANKPRFHMHEIVNYTNPFQYPDKAIGFLRRLYNFIGDSRFSSDVTDQSADTQRVLEHIGHGLPAAPTKSTSPMKRQHTASEDDPPNKKPKRDGGNDGGNNDNVMRVLKMMYRDVRQTAYPHVLEVGNSCKRFCVKWTRHGSEVELLQRLQLPQQGLRQEYVIPLVRTIPLAANEALLVMPLRTALGSLSYGDLTLEDYYDIREKLVAAVAFLHSQSIAHCDIKPDNIVLEWYLSPFGALSLIDFGNAVDLNKCGGAGFHGTPGYTAPEVVKGQLWDAEKADLWAMAQVLFEILGYRDPLLVDCFASDPARRPSAHHVLQQVIKQGPRVRQQRRLLQDVYCLRPAACRSLLQVS